MSAMGEIKFMEENSSGKRKAADENSREHGSQIEEEKMNQMLQLKS